MTLFKNEAAKARMVGWFERFRARLPEGIESRTVTTSFGRTHLLVGGPQGAPPLLISHGAMATSAHALVELAGLLARYRVYAVDVIGQSVMSEDTRLRVDDDSHGRWLVEVMNALSLQKTRVLGVSWGGFVSIRLAVVAPERIEKLSLLVPAGVVQGSWWHGMRRMGWPMTRYLLSPSPKTLEAFVENLLTTRDDDWKAYLGDSFLSYDVQKMKVPALAKVEELKALTCPVQVIAAEDDVSFPGTALLARARVLFPTLADAMLLPGSKHCPPTTDEFRSRLSAMVGEFQG